jgi:hypothetical protein
MQEKTKRNINRRQFMNASMSTTVASSLLFDSAKTFGDEATAKTDIEIAVYYFPNYHVDPRNEAAHGPGWTEWELVKTARSRFEGHQQPLVPVWGYEDESDPAVMEKKIDVAANHAIDHFIFDWYYFDDGPFLDRCLHEGYLRASNNNKVGFAFMWANHDWKDIHPARVSEQGVKNAKIQYPGAVSRETFNTIMDLVINKYFQHPSYWKIDGCPYFSFYELPTFVKGMGSLTNAIEALEEFRRKTKVAGFKDLHLNAELEDIGETRHHLDELGIHSVTNYNWGSFGEEEYPKANYNKAIDIAQQIWVQCENDYDCLFIPGVTRARDNSPRTCPSDTMVNVGYPYNFIHYNSTPKAFEKALQNAKQFLSKRPKKERILTINAWNEWTEGAYLEPDTIHGMEYLKAIKRVFG